MKEINLIFIKPAHHDNKSKQDLKFSLRLKNALVVSIGPDHFREKNVFTFLMFLENIELGW